jgi:diketogulonate reductase-like aldo/keto reductase
MPLFGLGTWKSSGEAATRIVEDALDRGVRLYDLAAEYSNQKDIGKAFHKYLSNPNSPLKREDLFISSKLWTTDHQKEKVRPACVQTLKELQLDYLDMYLIHIPIAQEKVENAEHDKVIFVPLRETWEAMEALVDEGLVKSIGVSNFPVVILYDLLSYARIKPAINQIERHPYLTQEKHFQFLKDYNVQLEGYCPLGSPEKATQMKGPFLLQDPKVLEISTRLGKTPAQVLINWSLKDGVPCIPKTINRERLEENIRALDFELSDADKKELDGLNCWKRFVPHDKMIPLFY